MDEVVLHPRTKAAADDYLRRPAHALLITGPPGSGKRVLAQNLLAQSLQIRADKVPNQPFVLIIGNEEQTNISVEDIRSINAFLKNKTAGKARYILIDAAERMSQEAQNALLKNLEEPPANTYFVLTTSSWELLLPTIRSRSQRLDVVRPTAEQLEAYFATLGFAPQTIQQAR